ncbi:hypothetical protein Ngar_c06690 [Candidatus Nitrososphaera gargensis Ga9.2]|uniref:Uncharacterized protein n=1 Tax=Nitrososphaera gargensis (strain Ga9.2) TaxID=1237085 RepID=K0II15_NITGG|nr:hypothetical protein Ngar_c06690 [Candidatus Nitrososphaera gargensis Ga9.2]
MQVTVLIQMINNEKIRKFRKGIMIAFAVIALIVGIMLILNSFNDVFGRLRKLASTGYF